MKHIYKNSKFVKQLSLFIQKQRWYRHKSSKINNLTIKNTISISENHIILVCVIEPQSKIYIIPIEFIQEKKEDAICIGTHEEFFIYEGCSSKKFCQAMWKKLQESPTQNSMKTTWLKNITFTVPESTFSTQGEQSNSNIIFDQKWLLKIFRQPQYGINPDLEINVHLSNNHFAYVPETVAAITYTSEEGSIDIGIMQKFIANAKDCWEHTLILADNYLNNRETIGTSRSFAQLLGKRTAELHMAMTSKVPSFSTEKITPQDTKKFLESFNSILNRVCLLLPEVNINLKKNARILLQKKDIICQQVQKFTSNGMGMKIRCHGDYHLGQVLKVDNDVIILDFEGEPLRSLEERRQKNAAFKDVAGMIRSFNYAIFKVAMDIAVQDLAKAKYWVETISSDFFQEYIKIADKGNFLPDRGQHKSILQLFLYDKALYELEYELNNRPDWAHIPLHGILSLLEQTAT